MNILGYSIFVQGYRMMRINIHKKFIHLEIIKKQTWFIYKIYNNGKLVCFMGQPIGNTRCSIFGITKDKLFSNIEKFIMHRNTILHENDITR